MNTSASRQSLSSACLAASLQKSATDRLLRLLLRKFAENPFCIGGGTVDRRRSSFHLDYIGALVRQ